MTTPAELHATYKTWTAARSAFQAAVKLGESAARKTYLEAVKRGESAVISAARAAVDAAWAAYANAISADGSW